MGEGFIRRDVIACVVIGDNDECRQLDMVVNDRWLSGF